MRLDNPRLIMKQSTIQLFFSADHKSWNLRPNHISKPTANTPVPKTPTPKPFLTDKTLTTFWLVFITCTRLSAAGDRTF